MLEKKLEAYAIRNFTLLTIIRDNNPQAKRNVVNITCTTGG